MISDARQTAAKLLGREWQQHDYDPRGIQSYTYILAEKEPLGVRVAGVFLVEDRWFAHFLAHSGEILKTQREPGGPMLGRHEFVSMDAAMDFVEKKCQRSE